MSGNRLSGIVVFYHEWPTAVHDGVYTHEAKLLSTLLYSHTPILRKTFHLREPPNSIKNPVEENSLATGTKYMNESNSRG